MKQTCLMVTIGSLIGILSMSAFGYHGRKLKGSEPKSLAGVRFVEAPGGSLTIREEFSNKTDGRRIVVLRDPVSGHSAGTQSFVDNSTGPVGVRGRIASRNPATSNNSVRNSHRRGTRIFDDPLFFDLN